ncbi:MAG: PIN domain-containing protein [Alphaproteobacteria bacterium]|nr:PIN domain-containing protein [Alphaproteobacteria bacterium]
MATGYLDTNILIGFFKGNEADKLALERFDSLKLPAIAYAEFMVGLALESQRAAADKVIDALFEIVHTDRPICREGAALRRDTRLKLPDAMIYATARVGGGILVTRNTKDFDPAAPDVYVP